MENASKALIMAAEVLVGVMIISVGVYLFNTFGGYSAETSKKIEDVQIAEFNNQFLKFYGTTTIKDDRGNDTVTTIKCTIHDIASLANLAKRNNTEYALESESTYSNSTRYIQIDIGNTKKIEKYTNDNLIKLIKDNDLYITEIEESPKKETSVKYYYCSLYNINPNTRLVNYMQFKEITTK